MRAFVGELRATSRTSVAVATPPIPAPATTAPGASSHSDAGCPYAVRVARCSPSGWRPSSRVALIAVTPHAAAPIRDVQALALELPAPRSARPASVRERAVRRSVRARRAPATRKPRHSPARTRRAPRDPATARPVSTTAPAASSLAAARPSPAALPRTSAPFDCCAVVGLGVPALTQRSPASHVPSHVTRPMRLSVVVGAVLGAVVVLAAVLIVPDSAHAALARAAGKSDGGADGKGFVDLVQFFDTVTTYLVWLGIPIGGLAVARAGVLYMAGNPMANQFFGGAAIGLVLVLLAKGIAL